MAQKREECVRPGAVTDDDLLACARGEAPPSVVEHVAICPACRARVAAYADLERRLLAGLFASSCLESLTLAEFALELLPADQRAAVADHLARCPDCRAVLRSFRSRPAPPTAPAPQIEDEPLDAEEPPQARAPAAVAATSAADRATRSVAAQGVRLSLGVRCACRPDGGAIVGRLEEAPDTLGDVRAALFQDDRCLEDRALDADGGFAFTRLTPGMYRVQLTLTSTVVAIASVQVP